MPLYDATVDPAQANSSHVQLIDLVGREKTVLDVGCATGYLAEALTARGCTVSGVELEEEAAALARPHLEHLVIGDIQSIDLDAAFGQRRFDVIVLGDVLEHLVDPRTVLHRLRPLLAPGGSFVVSIPHVAHGSVRLALLQGRWDYQDVGLLDRTHIRFFTRQTVHELCREAGLTVVQMRTTVLDPLDTEVHVDAEGLPDGLVEWLREQPDALTYQFVFRAVPEDDREGYAEAAADRAEMEGQIIRLTAELRAAEAARDVAEQGVLEIMGTRTFRWSASARALAARARAVLDRRQAL